MAQRGRTAGFQMGAEHRAKIANSQIFKRLLDHAEGNLPDLPVSERDTALALLRKVMPDMKPVDADGDTDDKITLTFRIGGDDAPR
jgi:hypothetical protein